MPVFVGTRFGLTRGGAAGGLNQATMEAAYISRMTTPPETVRASIINEFFQTLRTGGALDVAEHIWLLAATDGQAARLDAVSPAGNLLDHTAVTHTTDIGLEFSGTTNNWSYYFDGAHTFLTETTLPDTTVNYPPATPSYGFTCTGMDRLPDGTFIFSNFGLVASDQPEQVPTVIHTDASRSVLLDEVDLTAIFAFPDQLGIQGIAYDTSDDTVWVADLGSPRVLHLDLAGNAIGELTIATITNALAYDPVLDCLIVDTSSLTARWIDKTTGATIKDIGTGNAIDHFCFDPDLGEEGTLWTSQGPNGAACNLNRFDVATDTWTGTWGLRQARACEGIFVEPNEDGSFSVTVAVDGRYHAQFATNTTQTFRITEPLNPQTSRLALAGSIRMIDLPAATKSVISGNSGASDVGITIAFPNNANIFRTVLGSGDSRAAFVTNHTMGFNVTTKFRFYIEIDLEVPNYKVFINGVQVGSTTTLTGIKGSIPSLYWILGAAMTGTVISSTNVELGAFMVFRGTGLAAVVDEALADYLDAVTPAPPVNSVLPSYTGTLIAGQTLTYVAGTWTGSPTPTVTHEWYLNGVGTGNTGATFDTTGHGGKKVKIIEAGTNTSGSANATTAEQYISANSEAATLFAAFTTPPTDARKALIDAVYTGLKSDGSYTKISCLPVFAAADSQAALLDWKLPSRVFTAVNSPTFTADRGFAGNGTSSYIDTGVLASGLNGTSHSFGTYINVDGAGQFFCLGPNGATLRHGLAPRNTSGNLAGRDGSTVTQTTTATVAARTGLTSISREGSSTDYIFYYNGSAVETGVSGASGGSTGSFCFGLFGTTTFSPDRHAAGFICLTSGLTAAQMLNTRNTLLTYLTAVGAQ